MRIFTILTSTGKTDCPHYAKAELLADRLQRCLPNFRIQKISILPREWKEWLEATCKTNGWKHEQSPLVWRELVDHGGKGIILGDFSDFLEHCQDYYNITSDMSTDIMLSVAAENLETKMNLIAEEQHRVRLVKPLHIWISSLHLLDLEGNMEELQWLRMETEDLALGLLHQVTIHTDLEQAFREAAVILLLDEGWSEDGDRENEEETKKKMVKGISDRYREYGLLIDTMANKDVKVIVSGDSFLNLRCSLVLDNARSIDSRQFVAVATQLENEAKAIIAKKLKVRTSDIANVIVWGNISGSFYIDLQRAKVFNYAGAIKGPAFFSQPAKSLLQERKWLETDFQNLVRCQRAAVTSKTRRAAAMTGANGVLAVLKAWNGICSPDEVFSIGVLCLGYHNLPDGIVLSIPATFTDGRWSVLCDVTVGDELKERLQLSASELWQEKELGSENCTILIEETVDGC
ncbi:putative malate dehydrogenase 1B isoform X2 [Etheostoma spectabile]|uniref:putative malate dehydrogenase 1B isoform X2 n=1 Tax=Etheostoma spectabile TaxID=54343 RepID=UPI0013AF371C|nr:putative malate dehydrogenase 1B isoform X2 [Etheostoma spectabile]